MLNFTCPIVVLNLSEVRSMSAEGGLSVGDKQAPAFGGEVATQHFKFKRVIWQSSFQVSLCCPNFGDLDTLKISCFTT